ncbi:MAG: hypothetical protein ABFD97_16910 [Syntrophobacter sp.]
MARIISMESRRRRNAANRGFMEWRRLFQSITDFDQYTRWADLPDEVILFFCEEGSESKHALYDLIMRSNQLGNGHDFETQELDRLTVLMNAYFFITDQARFECMRRLGWIGTIPRADRSIIELVTDPGTYGYAAQFEIPEPTPDHPAYEEHCQSRGIDRAATVRKYLPEAIGLFKERVRHESSAIHGELDGYEETAQVVDHLRACEPKEKAEARWAPRGDERKDEE